MAILSLLGALARCAILYPFRSFELDHPPPEIAAKPAVVCVHGYLHNETPWGFYRIQLQKNGLGPVHTLHYPSIRWNIPQNSQIVKQRVEQIRRETGKEVNILIGHSLGGLVCLEYALEYAPKDSLTYIVTLGTPLHGTKMTALGFGPSVRQMEIGSKYLENLKKRLKNAKHLKVLALAARDDLIVQPPDSAYLLELPYATTEVLEDVGHVALLFSSQAVARILDFLKHVD